MANNDDRDNDGNAGSNVYQNNSMACEWKHVNSNYVFLHIFIVGLKVKEYTEYTEYT